MPTVPTYDSAQVLPGVSPAPYRQGNAPDTAINARQMGAAGDALQNAGATLTQEEVNAQGMANQVRVDDALNTVRKRQLALTNDPTNGYANKKGAAALDPDPLGRSLPQQYGEQLGDTINATAASLGNDAQRRVFNEQAANIATSFGGDVQRHMLQEFRSFGMETQQGTIKLAADAAKLNWDAPDKIGEQIQSASAAVWKMGQISGEPANLTAAKIKDTTSAIHSGVIMAMMENNEPATALSYIEAKKGEMSADDLLKANSIIKADNRARGATSAAQSAMADLRPKLAPTNFDKMVAVTEQTESGGNPNAVGKNIPGQGTAKGSMQVMDATAKNPGFGVKPVADDSPEERARVGRELIPALVQNYGGDPAKAWAAYNAGAGTVDKAIAAAKKNGTDWTAEMANFQSPANFKETQAYVAKNMAAMSKADTAPLPSLQDVHDNIRTKLGANPDPKLLAASLAEGTRMFTDFQADRKVKGDNAEMAAQQWLAQNNGNIAALPPQLRQAVLQYAPGKIDDLGNYAGKIADPVRADNLTAYNQAIGHPEEMAKMNDATFESFIKQNFTQRTARALARERQDQLDGKTDTTAEGLNRPAINSTLNNALAALKIPTAPTKGAQWGDAEKERIGGIRAFVDQSILAEQKQTGKKMTVADVQQHINKLFATDVTFKNTLWYGVEGAATSEKLMAMKMPDLPAGAADGLRKSLIAGGNRAPTDTDVLNLYRRLHQPK